MSRIPIMIKRRASMSALRSGWEREERFGRRGQDTAVEAKLDAILLVTADRPRIATRLVSPELFINGNIVTTRDTGLQHRFAQVTVQKSGLVASIIAGIDETLGAPATCKMWINHPLEHAATLLGSLSKNTHVYARPPAMLSGIFEHIGGHLTSKSRLAILTAIEVNRNEAQRRRSAFKTPNLVALEECLDLLQTDSAKQLNAVQLRRAQTGKSLKLTEVTCDGADRLLEVLRTVRARSSCDHTGAATGHVVVTVTILHGDPVTVHGRNSTDPLAPNLASGKWDSAHISQLIFVDTAAYPVGDQATADTEMDWRRASHTAVMRWRTSRAPKDSKIAAARGTLEAVLDAYRKPSITTIICANQFHVGKSLGSLAAQALGTAYRPPAKTVVANTTVMHAPEEAKPPNQGAIFKGKGTFHPPRPHSSLGLGVNVAKTTLGKREGLTRSGVDAVTPPLCVTTATPPPAAPNSATLALIPRPQVAENASSNGRMSSTVQGQAVTESLDFAGFPESGSFDTSTPASKQRVSIVIGDVIDATSNAVGNEEAENDNDCTMESILANTTKDGREEDWLSRSSTGPRLELLPSPSVTAESENDVSQLPPVQMAPRPSTRIGRRRVGLGTSSRSASAAGQLGRWAPST